MKEQEEFPRVEVHFKDSHGQSRVAVIAGGDERVKAIFLHGAEEEFVLHEREPDGKSGREIRKRRGKQIPDGVTLLPKGAGQAGPRGVCYVENGQYKCWGKS